MATASRGASQAWHTVGKRVARSVSSADNKKPGIARLFNVGRGNRAYCACLGGAGALAGGFAGALAGAAAGFCAGGGEPKIIVAKRSCKAGWEAY